MANALKRVPATLAQVPNICRDFTDLHNKLSEFPTPIGGLGVMIYDVPWTPKGNPKFPPVTTPYLVITSIGGDGQPDTLNAVSFELLPCPPLCPDRGGVDTNTRISAI